MRCGCSSWLGCIPYRIFLTRMSINSLIRASNDRVLFFFALVLVPVRVLYGPGRGGHTKRRKHLRCVVAWCSYTARLHAVVVMRSRAVYLRYCCAVSCQECYPQGLSTVWRTYTHVIWWSRVEAHRGCTLRALQKNSCNYRLSRPLKPRVSS